MSFGVETRDRLVDLLQFLAERYERRSVMVSTNLVFSKWDQIFKDPMTTMAAIDRLVHHSIILEFTGESIRLPKSKGGRSEESKTKVPAADHPPRTA